MEVYQNLKKGERGAWISIAAYILLTVVKIAVGYFFHSEALMADGLNNGTDVIASIAVLVGLKISQRPPDQDHHYGHFRAETIASLIASLIMVMVGFEVLTEGAKSIINPKTESPDLIAAWTAIGSAIVMFSVYLFNVRLAKKIKSQALMAAAMDNRSDAYVSVGTFLGILAAQFHIAWMDTVVAMIIGVLICKTAWDIFKEAVHSLTDGFSEKELDKYKETINNIPGVQSLEDIKARYVGSTVYVDVVIKVHSNLNVVESHAICDEVERRLTEEFNITNVHVHIEPLKGDN